MKELIGLIAKAKYQTKEFIPNSLHNLDEDQLELVLSAIHNVHSALEDLDHYIHTKLALVIETKPIVEQIINLKQQLIDTGTYSNNDLDMSNTDINRIINLFTKQLDTPQHQEYLLQMLLYAIKLWIYENSEQTHRMA